MALTTLSGVPYGPTPRTARVDSSHLSWPPRMVVIHDTSNPTSSAHGEANYAAHRSDAQANWTSAHFYIDDSGPLGSLHLDRQAWAAYGYANAHGWHLEMCGTNAGTAHAVPAATIAHTAALTRRLCDAANIPLRHLSPADIRAGRRGICGHLDITRSHIDGNDHTDPGPQFNWGHFMRLVKGADGHSDQEDDDMATWTSLSCTKTKTMPWGHWHNVDWDTENTDPSHAHANGNAPGFISPRDAYVFVDVYVRVRGLSTGDPAKGIPADGYGVRLSNNDWKDGHAVEAWHEPLVDGTANAGDQHIRVQGSIYMKKGRHLYIQLLPIRRGSAADAPAPEIVEGTWRIRQDG